MLVSEETLTCCSAGCGITFSVPAHWCKKRREDHTWWYCPNGHHQHFPGESEVEKARRERDVAKQQLARAEDERKEAERRAERAAQKADKAEAAKKRVLKRTAVGVCPCCSRTVGQLARHMKTKHPEFVAAETTNVVPIKKAAK